MQSKRNILVLCGRSPVALEMVRSFYRAGHKVVVADSKSSALCRWSNCKHKFYYIPAPVQEFEAFSKAVNKIVQDENISDCVPVYEESFYISMIKSQLNCKVWVPDFKLANRLHRKDDFIELAKQFFAVPKTINFSRFSDFNNLNHYIFKPIYSRFANNIIIKPQEHELLKIKNKNDWIAQEFIVGKEICVYSIWDRGQMKACCFYQPNIRFGKGASVYFESTAYPELRKRIEKFGVALNYQGQLSFDFIEKNEEYFVLECNPRATSGAHLFSQNLSSIFFESTLGVQMKLVSKGLKLLMFFKKPSTLFTEKYRSARDVVFDRKDILPMIMQLLSILGIITLAWRKKLTLLEATTYDIEWNGDEKSIN